MNPVQTNVRAVMEATGSERAVLMGGSDVLQVADFTSSAEVEGRGGHGLGQVAGVDLEAERQRSHVGVDLRLADIDGLARGIGGAVRLDHVRLVIDDQDGVLRPHHAPVVGGLQSLSGAKPSPPPTVNF